MVQRYEQMRRLQWYKCGAAYKEKKLIRAYTEMVCQRIMLSWPLIIDINVKNIKNDKNLREKHLLILGYV